MKTVDAASVINEYLRNEGYTPKTDSDGDIVFKHEGNTYIVIFDKDDKDFIRLVYPNFWSIESQDERVIAESAAARATGGTKVAKVFLVKDNTWAAVEIFTTDVNSVIPVFIRCIRAIRTAVKTFVAEMKK